MARSGLIGHTGFVGSNLNARHSFDACFNTQNIADIRGQQFDLLVCAAPQAKKWWANQHPDEDWALIEQLIEHLKQTQVDQFVLVSSIDVFPRITEVDETFDCASLGNHAYGRNRFRLEEFVRGQFPNAAIARLPGLFGPGLRKNVIFDMLHQNQLEKINPDSQFQWYDVTRLWHDIQTLLAHQIHLAMLATEPVATREIQTRFFPDLTIGGDAGATIYYDVRTCYAEAFGGQ